MADSTRIFTKAELEEYSKGFMDLALEALDKGDLETARRWCERNKETEWFLHDAYLVWIPEVLRLVYDFFGEDGAVSVVRKATLDGCEIFNKVREPLLAEKGIRGHVEFLVDYFWRHRFGSWTIQEDDERLVFTHAPCGSGGRLIDGKTFYSKAVHGGTYGLPLFRKPGAHTWGERDCPVYCSHCSFMHEINPVEIYGAGHQWWVHVSPFPRKSGDPCVHHIYKDPADIPQAYYDRVGLRTGTGGLTLKKKKRMFSEEELLDLSKGYMELALEALDKGDAETARKWCERFEETKCPVHDAYAVWFSAMLSHIADCWGENAAVATLKYSPMQFCEELFFALKEEVIKEKGVRGWVEFMVDFWRQHISPLTVEEDDEKIIMTVDVCGSGGRLVQMGYYETPGGHHRLKEAGPHTWYKEQQPIYCGHCTWLHEALPVFLRGKGTQLWVHPPPYSPDKPGDPCVHYIYKDPRKIPKEYYERIGMENWPVDYDYSFLDEEKG